MKFIKNLFLFVLIAGSAFCLVVFVAPVREKMLRMIPVRSSNVLSASTMRGVGGSASGQVVAVIGAGLQTVEKQLGTVKVSDILSQLQKAGVNVQVVEKLLQTKDTESRSKK